MKKSILILFLVGLIGVLSSFETPPIKTDKSTHESEMVASAIMHSSPVFNVRLNPDDNCTDWQLMGNGKYCRMCASGYGTYIPDCRDCPYCLPE
jgi:hypothetical protein